MYSALSLVLAVTLQGLVKPLTSQELSASTRPILTVAGLNPKDIVSVSRYTTKGEPYPSMVYRYVYRGDFRSVLKAFRSKLTEKNGWVLKSKSASEVVVSKNLDKGPVAVQVLLIHPTRLIKGPSGWKPAEGKAAEGWIWVSYNELIRTKK